MHASQFLDSVSFLSTLCPLNSEEERTCMAATDWFTNDRFGMFIHFGLYSNPAGVWKGEKITHHYSEWLQASEHVPRPEYRQLTENFNPEKFDADKWISDAKHAGMKYFLITAKHHDGFALWPSKVSTYNVVDATPYGKDILGPLAEACKKYDIKLGLYYSHWQDWEGTGGDVCATHMVNEEYVHPTDEAFEEYWQSKCLPQVRELMEEYGPRFFWFDSWNESSFKYITEKRQDELIDLIKSIDSNCLVNSRIQFLQPSDRIDYISTMDNTFPDEGFDKPWETSGTLNDSWGYHKLDYQWLSTRQLIQNLVKNAALGGNYQLNVGPMGNGCFQDTAIRRLRDIGSWLSVNGEAVYGTKGSPFERQPWGKITCKKSGDALTAIYLHLWDFTPGTAIFLKEYTGNVANACVLETGQDVEVVTGDNGLCVLIPTELNREDLPVIRLNL